MFYQPLEPNDLDALVAIFHHDDLKYASGEYPEAGWLKEFIVHGYARGLFDGASMKAALIAEPLLAGGVYLWTMAVAAESTGRGYGTQLFDAFEQEMRGLQKKWIFLTSTVKSEGFHRRNGFESQDLKVTEMIKSLVTADDGDAT